MKKTLFLFISSLILYVKKIQGLDELKEDAGISFELRQFLFYRMNASETKLEELRRNDSQTIHFVQDGITVTTNVCWDSIKKWYTEGRTKAGMGSLTSETCQKISNISRYSLPREIYEYLTPGEKLRGDLYHNETQQIFIPIKSNVRQNWNHTFSQKRFYRNCRQGLVIRNKNFTGIRWRDNKDVISAYVVATDNPNNPSHVARDMLFVNALLRRTKGLSNGKRLLLISVANKYDIPNMHWRQNFIQALSNFYMTHFDTRYHPLSTTQEARKTNLRPRCVDFIFEKSVIGGPSDVSDASNLRKAVYSYCGIKQQLPSSHRRSILFLHHGKSSLGDRILYNQEEVDDTLKRIVSQNSAALYLQYETFSNDIAFCDQVWAISQAKIILGIHGGAIGGNFILARDDTILLEFVLCPKEQNTPQFNHYSSAIAAGQAYGTFCLCLDHKDTTTRFNASIRSESSWFRSHFLYVQTSALTSALDSILEKRWPDLASALAAINCRRSDLVSSYV